MLSQRARHVVEEEFLAKCFYEVQKDEYDPQANRNGYVNLGTSICTLVGDDVLRKLNEDGSHIRYGPECHKYYTSHGIDRLRESAAKFLTDMLHTSQPIKPENLFFTTGVTSAFDLLAHCLADPGDVMLAPVPIYSRIYTNMKIRSLVDIWPIRLQSKPSTRESYPFQLTLERIRAAHQEALEHEKRVRGLILLNPNNPLGHIYDSDLLLEILHFCHENEMHLIVDEVYAFSIFNDPKDTFRSILSFPVVPDPQKVHFLYGLSKDFALPGFRVGMVHTLHPGLQHRIRELSHFAVIPIPIMEAASRVLSDLEWCRMFFKKRCQKLASASEYCITRLRSLGLKVEPPPPAAFCVWVDFTSKLSPLTFEEERRVFRLAFERFRFYMVPGGEFYCPEPGWFRIIFAVEKDYLEEGLNRLEELLKGL